MVNPLRSSVGEESGPQGPPIGQRAEETGASEGCPVMGQIGTEVPRESGLTLQVGREGRESEPNFCMRKSQMNAVLAVCAFSAWSSKAPGRKAARVYRPGSTGIRAMPVLRAEGFDTARAA